MSMLAVVYTQAHDGSLHGKTELINHTYSDRYLAIMHNDGPYAGKVKRLLPLWRVWSIEPVYEDQPSKNT